MSHYKLTYFKVRARAELLKIIFAAAGVEYENHTVEGADWPALKSKTPFGSMPLLEVDGITLAQTKAIGRFLARRFGLDGETEIDKVRADMIIDSYDDITHTAQHFLNEKDEAKKVEAKKKFHDEQLPVYLGNLEKLLNENKTGSGYFAGKNLTWADLGLFVLVEKLNAHQVDGVLAKFEKLSALHKRVSEHPKIATWNANRPQIPIMWV